MCSTGSERERKPDLSYFDLLLHPTFFASIIQYVALATEEKVVFEREDNFQKQTYRNRCYICGPNGKQLLSVPVQHAHGKGRQKTKDIRIDNGFRWQINMFRSLEASYRSSPFFEFYEDEIGEVFSRKFDFLLDLNLATFEVVSACLGLETEYEFTERYEDSFPGVDLRPLVNAKSSQAFELTPYTQVFENKHDFIPNLSILDLLFNEGTNALAYLQDHRSLLNL